MSKPVFYAKATVANRDGEQPVVRVIGAAFPFKEGEGYVVNLNTIPVNWDGAFILVKPKEGSE